MESQLGKERIRVLIVEDGWLLRRATALLLKREPDMEVVGTAADGSAALAKIPDLQPDLVVTDIAMPHMGGLELTYLLRRRYPTLGIVLVGCVNEHEISDLCGLSGADVLINKPLLPERLAGVVRLVYAARKLTDSPVAPAPATADSERLPEEIAFGA